MPTVLFRAQTPAEAELAQRRLELAAARATLAARELDLAHLRAQLSSFEARYIRQVGVLYRQLDEWEQRIADLNNPNEAIEEQPAAEPPEPAAAPKLTLDLKSLFRELAKLIHPDHAKDPHDEQHRTRLMAQANDAYRRDDAAILQRMINGYDPSTEPTSATDIAAELTRVLNQLRQIRHDTETLDTEIEALTHSEMAGLQQRTILAATKGRDLLAELAARVKGRIGMAMRRFELDSSPNRRKPTGLPLETLLSAETRTPDPRPR